MKVCKTYKLRGHFTGQSVVLGGFHFSRGLVSLEYTPEIHERIARHLAQWQAEEIDDGKCDVQTVRAAEVVGQLQPEGQGVVACGQESNGCRATEAATGNPTVNVGAEGDRQTPSVVDELLTVMRSLDQTDDRNWTSSGRPSLAAIEAVIGYPVTRAKVDEVAPGFRRHGEGAGK